MKILSVADVSRRIFNLLRADRMLSDVWIRGEISDVSKSPAGHYYFALRDRSSQLKCVLFRAAAIRSGSVPKPGAAVIVHGNVVFYEGGGVCQVCVDLLYPEGVGLARLQLDALKLKLESEGLFAKERKRPLPPFPTRIGLVTSERGAVLHDVLQVLERRYPLAELIFSPASVQGERAADEVCASLARLVRLHRSGSLLDVIIVARGGGAEQELAVFNDEQMARAVFGCPVPVMSAIGHETDFTLVDHVADVRAPTPSAAAELVAPDINVLRVSLRRLAQQAQGAARRSIEGKRSDLQSSRGRMLRRSPALELARRRADLKAVSRRCLAGLQHKLRLAREQTHGRYLQIEALSPDRTLERGYAICTMGAGTVLRSIYQPEVGDDLDIRVRDGSVLGRATGRREKKQPVVTPVDGERADGREITEL